MWKPVADANNGIVHLLNKTMLKMQKEQPWAFPDLLFAETLFVTSDYSRGTKKDKNASYSFLVTSMVAALLWLTYCSSFKYMNKIPERHFEYKKLLGDNFTRRLLPEFLNYSNLLPGLCFVIVIDSKLESLFNLETKDENGLDFLERVASDVAHLDPSLKNKKPLVEEICRSIFILSFILAGLSRSGQNLLWLPDHESWICNEARQAATKYIFEKISSTFPPSPGGSLYLKSIRTSPRFEDLLSIADLAAGGAAGSFQFWMENREVPKNNESMSLPHPPDERDATISIWLRTGMLPLRRYALYLSAGKNKGQIEVANIGCC